MRPKIIDIRLAEVRPDGWHKIVYMDFHPASDDAEAEAMIDRADEYIRQTGKRLMNPRLISRGTYDFFTGLII